MIFSKKFVSECREYSSYTEHVAAPMFRKIFDERVYESKL